MSDWLEIRATVDPAPEDWSLFADAFDVNGCPGSLIEGSQISGYLSNLDGAAGIAAALRAQLIERGATSVEINEVPDQDWSELWKIHFKPRRVGNRFVIRPTWEPYHVGKDDVEIVLDPGQAFGTGDHQTTRLCLKLLEWEAPLTGKSLADVGCGSGVLAIGAAKMGAHPIVATDLDPLSVEITRENMRLNGVEFKTEVAAGFEAIADPVDVALSNIISATLIRLAPDAAHRVKPGGKWIVSGVIAGNWPDVWSAAASVGFELERLEQEDDWIGATFRR